MSPFGLFDLLKTLLPTPEQTPTSPPSSPLNTDMETDSAAPYPQPAEPSENRAQTPPVEIEKPNACAAFLYRHEQRAGSRKPNPPTTKKRLD